MHERILESQMLEGFLAAVIAKLADGELVVEVDDLLAVEGRTLLIEDHERGFVVTVKERGESLDD